MKKGLCFMLAFIIIFCVSTNYVSAIEHGHNSLQYSCSGTFVRYNPKVCEHRGKSYGGVYHSDSCQVVQSLRFTTIQCMAYGCTFSHTGDLDYIHVCDEYHTGAFLIEHPCPYT